ncbi:MauE/DoxX family redox-associated membrane protein [Pedobacter vanadiisoli]|uniref:MauE/DoxX family redox-associated membrane protein n=1 Tax=Pedobacter vanadiisoli TaxID=1761975 RepID=A0ABW5MM76_9SPHI
MGTKVSKVISAAFILLWVYTAGSKLANFQSYRQEMSMQVFSPAFTTVLIYAIPSIEILCAILLLIKKTNKLGLGLSLLLMLAFTGYILLIISGYFPKTPCSCGGVIKAMGWKTHLIFNLFFLTAAILALHIKLKREVRDND